MTRPIEFAVKLTENNFAALAELFEFDELNYQRDGKDFYLVLIDDPVHLYVLMPAKTFDHYYVARGLYIETCMTPIKRK